MYALLKAMVAKVRAISSSQLVQLVQRIPFLLRIFKSLPLPCSKEISNAKHTSASTILFIQDGKRREMFTALLKVLNRLCERHAELIFASLQQASISGINTPVFWLLTH